MRSRLSVGACVLAFEPHRTINQNNNTKLVAFLCHLSHSLCPCVCVLFSVALALMFGRSFCFVWNASTRLTMMGATNDLTHVSIIWQRCTLPLKHRLTRFVAIVCFVSKTMRARKKSVLSVRKTIYNSADSPTKMTKHDRFSSLKCLFFNPGDVVQLLLMLIETHKLIFMRDPAMNYGHRWD